MNFNTFNGMMVRRLLVNWRINVAEAAGVLPRAEILSRLGARSERARTWWALGGCLVLALLLRVPYLSTPLGRDEGGIAYVASHWSVGHGSLYGAYWVDRPPLLIAETRHGFVCASAGVDASNAPEAGTVVLLPEDPDASAERIRARLQELSRRTVAVLVTDSFGRAWRDGTTDVAIGAAGLQVLLDLHGERDPTGYELHSTMIAVADEIAGAAELVMGKLSRVPAAVVRGLDLAGSGRGRDLVMPPDRDLFR